jgi:hypothetical protein
MWYRGGGIGHLATQQCNETLLADKHTLWEEPQDSDEESDKPVGEEGNGEGEEDSDEEGNETDSKDESVREENDDELAVATNDVEVVNAAGLAVL